MEAICVAAEANEEAAGLVVVEMEEAEEFEVLVAIDCPVVALGSATVVVECSGILPPPEPETED